MACLEREREKEKKRKRRRRTERERERERLHYCLAHPGLHTLPSESTSQFTALALNKPFSSSSSSSGT
jgi:hypothetical protein